MVDHSQSFRGHASSPRLDVIIPVRPNPPRLRMVLQSLTQQGFKDWRLIALLDRDQGENRNLINEIVRENEVISIECNYKSEGFSAMLNKGLRASNAEFVARQDDDDISLPGRFTSQVELLENNKDLVLAAGFATIVNGQGEVIGNITHPTSSSSIALELIRSNVVPHSAVMFRRDAVMGLGGYNEEIHGCEDYELWLRLITAGGIGSVGLTVLQILKHDGGMSRTAIRLSVLIELNRVRWRAARFMGLTGWQSMVASAQWTTKQVVAQLGWHN